MPFPIPGQQLEEPVPPGLVRVVFFNTSNKIVYPTSGSVRIQLNGQTVPTVHFDNYTQIFVEPGEYELEFRLDGYESVKHVIYVAPGRSYKIHYAMFPTDDDEGEPTSAAESPERPQ